MAMDNLPILLANLIGKEDAAIVAKAAGVDVSDIYVYEPSMRDHKDISMQTDANLQEELSVIACVRNGNRERVLDTDKMENIPFTQGMRLVNIVTEILIELYKAARDQKADDVKKLGLTRWGETEEQENSSSDPSAPSSE